MRKSGDQGRGENEKGCKGEKVKLSSEPHGERNEPSHVSLGSINNAGTATGRRGGNADLERFDELATDHAAVPKICGD